MAFDNDYREITVRDLVEAVKDRRTFPLGMDTPIVSGDFECNATHLLHMVQHFDDLGRSRVVLAYEMHENLGKF